MASATKDSDDDPVTAEYDVFITPESQEQLYLLQYPNRGREKPYNEREGAKPLEIRIKPNSGFMEMDVALNTRKYYDKLKGIQWGQAMRESKEDGIKEFGLAAGFNNTPRALAPKPARPGPLLTDEDGVIDADDDALDQMLRNFDDIADKGHALNTHTLGGQILKHEPGNPIYMLGTFRGNELHLTQVSGVVQMRPQFHHIDAQVNRERRKEAVLAPPPAERQVHLVAKSADGEDLNMVTMQQLLAQSQKESWTKLRYHDEDTEESYAAYHDKLFVQDVAEAPKLASSMDDEQYLDAISAPRIDPTTRKKKLPLSKKQAQAIDRVEDGSDGNAGTEPAASVQEDVVMSNA